MKGGWRIKQSWTLPHRYGSPFALLRSFWFNREPYMAKFSCWVSNNIFITINIHHKQAYQFHDGWKSHWKVSYAKEQINTGLTLTCLLFLFKA